VDGSAPAIGFVAPSTSRDARRLEEAGATSLWVGGHLASPNPSPEPIAWLARLVEQTRSAMLGTAALVLPWYPPALVAKQIADLDRASGGRLALGVGVGGEYASDFEAAGVPLEERGARTNEAIPLLRQFWSGEPVEHHGTHFHFDGVRIHPPPSQAGGPPIIVTGRRLPAMRRAVLLGDGWMPYLYSASRYASSVARIEELAGEAGRDLADFRWLAYLMVGVDRDPQVARRAVAAFLGRTYNQDFDAMLDHVAVAGATAEVGDKLQSFVDAGARHLVLLPCGADPVGIAEQLIAEVAPRLQAPIGTARAQPPAAATSPRTERHPTKDNELL
jgi:alkanesulfonate monooxygenase SsuD/methylene tetrahydromethanopterin reductase-like flavin-dependent oxidoreductase (luciferase family)